MKRTLALIFALLLLSGCAKHGDSVMHTRLCYTDTDDGSVFAFETRTLSADDSVSAIPEVFTLLSKPSEKKHESPLISSILLLSYDIENETAVLELSPSYADTGSFSQTLINGCLTLSLCELPGISRIRIDCEGNTTQYFSPSDFITEVPEAYYSTRNINLYFADKNFEKLLCEPRAILLTDPLTIEKLVINELMRGSSSSDAVKTIPSGTILNDIYVADGVCVIDFSREFVSNAVHTDSAERLTIYSIVNTMTELPMIDSVKFLIDGSPGYGYTYFNIAEPFTNAPELKN